MVGPEKMFCVEVAVLDDVDNNLVRHDDFTLRDHEVVLFNAHDVPHVLENVAVVNVLNTNFHGRLEEGVEEQHRADQDGDEQGQERRQGQPLDLATDYEVLWFLILHQNSRNYNSTP